MGITISFTIFLEFEFKCALHLIKIDENRCNVEVIG